MFLGNFESDVLHATGINENDFAQILHQVLVVLVPNQTVVPESLELGIDVLSTYAKLGVLQQEQEDILQQLSLLIGVQFAKFDQFL